MSASNYPSWGRYPASQPAAVQRPAARPAALPASSTPMLAYGNGRSYGDSCLNNDGLLIDIGGLDRFISFDPATGILECESGVLLTDILELVVPQGWFLPVTPGTQFVSVGGAIANDVHGKNHHGAGTFGRHVRSLDLLRSDGTALTCTPNDNAEWFAATVGGLGLTGLVTKATIALKRIEGPFMDVDTLRFRNLDEFFAISAASDSDYEYTVAWVDCTARGGKLGRGWFMRANHKPALGQQPDPRKRGGPTFPFVTPISMINGATLRPLNTLYFHRKRQPCSRDTQHFQPYFYPLDGIKHWNRAYGPKGFLQYQCVVPHADARASIAELLERIAAAGAGSFLSVLKVFGDVESPGLMSFPRPGVTLALDFPNRGRQTFTLLDRLDDVVRAAGGAVYPAKDARMGAAAFKQYFPATERFKAFVDPAFSSDFWRRVTGEDS
ncbi:FAD linked oxidase domain-containing protein [Salinisphaera dokdonensis CL-ES53]|uniref:FAD linked oxidase domain-containing protein n=1 Tax=Salinisphaera dokdonensis CL-ES53 TaxID=1304272 RepID=A0ABV2AXW0_9GAMM